MVSHIQVLHDQAMRLNDDGQENEYSLKTKK